MSSESRYNYNFVGSTFVCNILRFCVALPKAFPKHIYYKHGVAIRNETAWSQVLVNVQRSFGRNSVLIPES